MKLYNDYKSYLKQRYGCRVYRIGLDAGFSCPNRDGTKGVGGCIYCNEDGSRSSYTNRGDPIAEQLRKRIEYLKAARGAKKFIAYFQAFTNTYAQLDRLKAVYDEVLPFEEIVGISVGTRPDTIDRDKLKLIASYKDRYEIWIEYGLESIHDRTLRAINRGHNFKDFLEALSLTKEYDIPICVHVILGLPGETRNDMLETAKRLSELKVGGVKIHLLHILKGSALEKLYHEGKIRVLAQDEYAELVCDFLEKLASEIIVHRLTGEGPRDKHIAPSWAFDKIGTIDKIKDTLKRRHTYQGVNYKKRAALISSSHFSPPRSSG